MCRHPPGGSTPPTRTRGESLNTAAGCWEPGMDPQHKTDSRERPAPCAVAEWKTRSPGNRQGGSAGYGCPVMRGSNPRPRQYWRCDEKARAKMIRGEQQQPMTYGRASRRPGQYVSTGGGPAFGNRGIGSAFQGLYGVLTNEQIHRQESEKTAVAAGRVREGCKRLPGVGGSDELGI